MTGVSFLSVVAVITVTSPKTVEPAPQPVSARGGAGRKGKDKGRCWA